MSKEKDNIIQALDNIAITFDELGFEPTTANDKNYEHFNEWFLSEIEIIKSNAIKQEQQIDQLKQQLEESFTEEDVEGLIEDRDKTIKFMQKELTEKQNAIDEINKEFVQAIHNWKALCAEKDKEIERLKVFEKAYYFNQLQASQEDIQQFQQLANQSAVNINHIAITELEKVKEFILENTMLETETAAVLTYIYQQIKELKGEKEVED